MNLMNNGETHMDEKMMRKINRQLRAIKVMLGFFTLMFIGMIAILGFIAWKVVTFTQDVSEKITNIQTTTEQKLDVKSELCKDATSNVITNQFCN